MPKLPHSASTTAAYPLICRTGTSAPRNSAGTPPACEDPLLGPASAVPDLTPPRGPEDEVGNGSGG